MICKTGRKDSIETDSKTNNEQDRNKCREKAQIDRRRTETKHRNQRGVNTKRSTIVFFLGPTKAIPLLGKPAPAIQCQLRVEK